MNNLIEKLSALFGEFPGVGPRQAKRFVYALINKDEDFVKNLSSLVLELKTKINRCPLCFYTFTAENAAQKCSFCENPNRDKNILMVVQKEVDLENIEKSKCHNGKYFVLGGAISLLKPETVKNIRMRELFYRVKNDKDLKEIIIAMNADKEGEATVLYIEKIMEPFIKSRELKITRFGRGLQSGAEIEYADIDTLQNAFLNRK